MAKKKPWFRGKQKPRNRRDSTKDRQGGGPCTASSCPHVSHGHCQNVLCGNYFMGCPIHGLGD